MKISATFYNAAGELMAPRPLDVKLGSVTPGGRPTLEVDFYHRFKFEGRTAAEYENKRRRFFAEMRSVPGYATLVQRPYTVEMDSYVRFGLDVVYVVESTQATAAAAATAPTHRPADASRAQTSAVIVRR